MAKTLLLALGVMAMAAGWAEATTISVPADNPKYPGKCWTDTEPVDKGGYFYLPDCVRVRCHRTEHGMRLDYETCPIQGPRTTCTAVADLRHKYPYCCPRLICG
ncbi:uncharacterized protein LOC125029981 [Penaeus chinensis]|uniref:uncharacterized protein LOC125029981 n=1 Tax=Penaeus chinensis TaxID=139456 RepID=UPI001FB61BB8|nr:uncharacterized protein LOC125029981 [Penaeus chinensis]